MGLEDEAVLVLEVQLRSTLELEACSDDLLVLRELARTTASSAPNAVVPTLLLHKELYRLLHQRSGGDGPLCESAAAQEAASGPLAWTASTRSG